MSRMRSIPGGVTAPRSFLAAGVRCGIKQHGLDLAIICSERECTAAGVFTTNSFQAASVVRNKQKLESGVGRAVVVNSGNANACTGRRGIEDVDHICLLASEFLGIAPGLIYNASTGIIGVPLPMNKIAQGVRQAAASLSKEGSESAAQAIMTTDTRPKAAAFEVDIGGKLVRIGGICKGAGMICPNLATMLCFITTDAAIRSEVLQASLLSAVDVSFNSLTVEGDMSTNDTVLAFANGASGCEMVEERTSNCDLFQEALTALCIELAKAIARDGEGATKFVEVRVVNAATYEDAKTAAMSIANSPLVKTAIFGEDPNWGRVLCAAGKSRAAIVPERTSLYFGDVKIVENGEPLGVDAEAARRPMQNKELVITLDLGVGDASAAAFTCDLSYDYVRINAEYHT